MLITKVNPVGLDASLQKLQTRIHDQLVKRFGSAGSWNQYRAYGRCYRNKTSAGYVAENYEGAGEYKEVFWDDTLAMISFFGAGARVQHQALESQDIHMVIFADLAQLFPAIGHRADEELHKTLLNIVGRGLAGFTYTGYETGIENVLREYPGSRQDGTRFDMHPVHAFRLNFSTVYSINQC